MTTHNTPTLSELAETVREVNTANGWYEDERTYGEDLALLHSEVSEALEAFRDHGTEDTTEADMSRYDSKAKPPKPEGFGSELADILVRLLDTYTRRRNLERPWWWNITIADLVGQRSEYANGIGVGDQLAYLHQLIATDRLSAVAGYVAALARFHQIDLESEFVRKVAFNRTRGHRHGGKRL